MASASVPIECMFSTASLIANEKRSNLSPYKLEQILIVRDNFGLAESAVFVQICRPKFCDQCIMVHYTPVYKPVPGNLVKLVGVVGNIVDTKTFLLLKNYG